MAHEFGFTPEEVDKMPYTRVMAFRALNDELSRRESDSVRRPGRGR